MDNTPNRVAAYKALLGPTHQDFYLSYFRRAEERGYAPVSWHWPVFFFAIIWLLWRRQYTWALITTGVIVAAPAIAWALEDSMQIEGLAQGAHLLIVSVYGLVYLPMKANSIYYNWAKTTVNQIQAQLPGQVDKQLETLQKIGGTNSNVPIGVMVLLILLSLITAQPPELVSQ